MREGLTEQEIESYRTNGFVAIEDFLSPAELDHWRAVVDAAVADESVRQPVGSNPRVNTQRMNLRWTNAKVGELVQDPRVGRLAVELEGVDAMRICLDQALIKEPFGQPTQYHLDLPWWCFESDHACTIWVALDDSTVGNGALYFVPGSHRFGLDYRSDLGSDLGAVFSANPGFAYSPVPRELPAGGCTFHNARTIHGAGANMTSGRRRAMTAAFMPDGVRFNGLRNERMLATEDLTGLVDGEVWRNDRRNPVVYARGGTGPDARG
ncbi:phytanoyl-CoA dioxygenase family protein [Allokutzneria sp. A3M-2-11 16]|uniref:phytanoyl-CoA dioxygenase family protein n=1 Tax=Allokutzneria sp. A3M-2-11 16 TaxID=2962043 RepID=UPI0020B7BEFA|nr:phytanoyl-CoA dioxygenase family protein [Allokutzneria sp. A3M-2-11 16]MCP3802358.1 phytanoyl-CoA dioxygenase family protein [Allokutzneria sp. A3M-2-11 16]